MNLKIAIDGPSGAGKSTLAKNLAKQLGLVYFDTGSLYRAVGLFVLRLYPDSKYNETAVTKILDQVHLDIKYIHGSQHIFLNGEDVTSIIRTPEISMAASRVSAYPTVRRFLLNIQRGMAANGNVVMDGRDIGTVIMPDADIKLFLDPNVEVRAQRRFEELIIKGEKTTFSEILESMQKRDKNDKTRDLSPAVPADDAIFIDNTLFTPTDTLNEALKIINERVENMRKKERADNIESSTI